MTQFALRIAVSGGLHIGARQRLAVERVIVDPDRRRRLARARDPRGRPFTIVELPMPRPVRYQGRRLPATYMNFYFVNGGLLVPTFGQRSRDPRALAALQRVVASRRVVGVHCGALIWGGWAPFIASRPSNPRFSLPLST